MIYRLFVDDSKLPSGAPGQKLHGPYIPAVHRSQEFAAFHYQQEVYARCQS